MQQTYNNIIKGKISEYTEMLLVRRCACMRACASARRHTHNTHGDLFISWMTQFFYFLLKDNCFTELCFLSNLNMNQP